MNALIGCECSGKIRDELRRHGVNAYSCDLKPDEKGSPYHIVGDIFDVLRRGCPTGGKWRGLIAHPTCTYLCNSGVLHLYQLGANGKRTRQLDKWRWLEMARAAEFFRKLWEWQGLDFIALENPVMHGHAQRLIGCGKATQSIQPYEFGDDASKRTCLWLKGFRPLVKNPTQRRAGRWVTYKGKRYERWANQTDSGQNRETPSEHRQADRSRTYDGIARAIGDQWSELLMENGVL